jgi:hypothetical protein
MSPSSPGLDFVLLEHFAISKRKNSKRSKQRTALCARQALCTYLAEFASCRKQLTLEDEALLCDDNRAQGHEGLQSLIAELESKVRNGNTEARHVLMTLIPIAAISHVYDIKFKNLSTFNINVCPDIFSQILQATMVHTVKEDTLITFLRSTIPVLNNYNKIHRDLTWPIAHQTSLKILIRCCFPTLLSLYPMPNIKDVCFKLRVSLFRFLCNLLSGSHEQRAKFVAKYKSIVRLCLVEYVFYSISQMSCLPELPNSDEKTWNALSSAAYNTGQHFRVDLNTEHARGEDLESALDQCRTRAQILYDRNVRISKTARRTIQRLSKKPKINNKYTNSDPIPSSGTHIQGFADYGDILQEMPWFGNFQIAEMYFRRHRVPMSEIARVWDCMSSFQVFPLPSNIVLCQHRALFKKCEGNTLKMETMSCILLCVQCSTNPTIPSFRRCVNTGTFCCSRCNHFSTVFKVNMLGRVLYINKIPFVLSTCCSKIVVWSGLGYEFGSPEDRQIGQRHFPCSELHTAWSEQTNMSSVKSLVQNAGIGSFIVQDLRPQQNTRRKLFLNPDFSLSENQDADRVGTRVSCSLCKSTNIYATYELLHVKCAEIVVLHTCYKHSVHKKYEKYCLYTLFDYIRLMHEKS